MTGKEALSVRRELVVMDTEFGDAVREAADLFSKLEINAKLRKEVDGGATSKLIQMLVTGAPIGVGESRMLAELLAGYMGRQKGDRSERFPVKAAKRKMIKVAKLRSAKLVRAGMNPLDAKPEAAKWAYRKWGRKLGLRASTIERKMDERQPKIDRYGSIIIERPATDK